MSKLVSNNTYSNILQVSWDIKYIAHTDYDFETLTEVTTWITSNNQPATSGYYLSVDKQLDDTYIVQLLKLTFNEKGTITDGAAMGALYKLYGIDPQNTSSYYIKNGNKLEELNVNQSSHTFTTDPTTDHNFYIYQRGIEPFVSVPPLPRLVYYDSGTKYYYPLIKPTSTLTWNGYIYSYDRSIGDTFGVALNNTKYVVPNKRVAAQTYDISAGTYTPSAFKNLIQKFISNNGNRTVSNSFSVTVNGQTLSIAAGTKIYYVTEGSSPWYARAVCFGVSWFQVAACVDKVGFSNYKAYIVETSNSNSYPNSYCFNYVFRYYASYNITVNTGIKFK